MSDVSEITALVHAYGRRLDAGDFDGVAALFERAVWRSPDREEILEGSGPIRRIYDKVHVYEDGTPRTHHLLSNLTIEIDETGEGASSHCYVTVIQGIAAGEPINIVLSAQYIDKFAKTDGTWHFSERFMVSDMMGDLSRHYG